MKVFVYATDLSDREWHNLSRLLPPEKTGGRPRIHTRRLVCDAIFYLAPAGCAWHLLPGNSSRLGGPRTPLSPVAFGGRVAVPASPLAPPGQEVARAEPPSRRQPPPTSQSAQPASGGSLPGWDGGRKVNWARKRHLQSR